MRHKIWSLCSHQFESGCSAFKRTSANIREVIERCLTIWATKTFLPEDFQNVMWGKLEFSKIKVILFNYLGCVLLKFAKISPDFGISPCIIQVDSEVARDKVKLALYICIFYYVLCLLIILLHMLYYRSCKRSEDAESTL